MSLPKTTNEAHDYALRVVRELQCSGIETIIKKKDVWSPELLKKYGTPDRASSDRWCRALFKVKSRMEAHRVFDAAQRIRYIGISFDHGGGHGSIDWELDWSFQYQPRVDKHSALHDAADDLIRTALFEPGEARLTSDPAPPDLGDMSTPAVSGDEETWTGGGPS